MKKVLFRCYMNMSVLCTAIYGVCKHWFILVTKGQKPEYEILQTAHRLEKGLLNSKPKPMWGWDKARRLNELIKSNNRDFSTITGGSVLSSYLEQKSYSSDERERKMASHFPYDLSFDSKCGGARIINKTDVATSEEDKKLIEHFFNSRHSVRDYSEEKVKKEDIEAAISLAMRCPSACNRQPTKCYVYQSDDQQTIIITVNVRAYSCSEFYDWFVSPSIFAAYLSLTLHLYGIGNCIYRKQLYGDDSYNKKMKSVCDIPDDEMIVLELKFGYYKDSFGIACSNRADCSDITSFVSI